MKIYILLTLVFIFSYTSEAWATKLSLRYFQSDERYNYRIALIKEVIRSADEKIVLDLVPIKLKVSPKRGESLLEKGDIDFASFPVTREREEKFLSIPIPILGGILGYRIFFANKKLLDKEIIDIRKTKMGFNEQWSDYAILKSNSLNLVKTSADYEALFKMLNMGRFLLFPRGINEVFVEYEKLKKGIPNVFIENKYALYYEFPVYFYVNKNNKDLANLIRKGLIKLKKSKKFENLFLKYHSDMINKAELNKREVIKLNNLTLPKGILKVHQFWKK